MLSWCRDDACLHAKAEVNLADLMDEQLRSSRQLADLCIGEALVRLGVNLDPAAVFETSAGREDP